MSVTSPRRGWESTPPGRWSTELQILYAKHAGEGEGGDEQPEPQKEEPGGTEEGRKQADSPLWTPPGTGDG